MRISLNMHFGDSNIGVEDYKVSFLEFRAAIARSAAMTTRLTANFLPPTMVILSLIEHTV
jgi:hypothetical protein